MKRSPSSGYGFEPNKNTDWLENDWSFFACYALFVAGVRVALGVCLWILPLFHTKWIWSIIHIFHAALSFILLHWFKGTPFWLSEDQGRYDNDTFWEQIDHGRQNTSTRKIFTIVPVVLFLIASYETQWHTISTIINVVFLAFVLVPKLPAMDHVRIAGINQD